MKINKTEKELLKECIKIIDEWDLVNAEQPGEYATELITTLVESAVITGIDPNELQSLKPMLGETYKIVVKRK